MKRLYGYLALLLCCICLAGCAKSQEKIDKAAYHYYYINAQETELVRDVYEPSKEDPDVIIQELLTHLGDPSQEGGYLNLLPEGVDVPTHVLHNNLMTLDFNKGYYEMDKAREVLTRAGLVKTFTQVPQVKYVKITVEGEPLIDSRGEALGAMTGDTFVENAGKDLNTYQYTRLTLYFTNEEGNSLIPETRSVYYSSNVSLERVVIDQLLKGPRQEGLRPTLPSETTILGVTTADKNCYVNFDRVFSEEALAVQEDIPIYSIVNSLAETCGIQKVQISIDGDSDLTFRETMKLGVFYEKKPELVQTEIAE